ncbi:hypothetical protein AAFC00_004015 [Neodothiora populina]|uniref:Life-span regulatory factor-domain-containing protein n=1 Tax=Neodothiora populina TaxID=2781224 RepID=A0ABR3PI97_9PEZI
MSPPQNTRPPRRALPVHTKPARPAPLVTRKSNTCLPPKKSPICKSSPGSSKSAAKREAEVNPDDDDMAGLPQFCATCEKQIVTPDVSILYCSENCRKKDHNKPLEESILPPEMSPQISSRRASYMGEDVSYDLAMRSPTAVRPPSLAFSDSSDSSSLYDRRSSYARHDSDVANYLSHFAQFEHDAEHNRRGLGRPSTSNSTAPSLSHTPTSVVSTSGSYRPLPRRGDPFSASFSSFSVDLITPVINMDVPVGPANLHCRAASVGSTASTDTAFRSTDKDMNYQKVLFSPGSSVPNGSLKQLFSHKAMQAPPRVLLEPPLSPGSKNMSDCYE